LKIKRKENCILLESGTVEYQGVILKKVNTAIINHKRTTYFKCKNMRTPSHVSGICVFSGRIVDFPVCLDLEILHDHSQTCCFAKGKKDLFSNQLQRDALSKLIKERNSNNGNFIKRRKCNTLMKQLSNKEEKYNQSEIIDYQDGIDLPNIYVQLWTDDDINRVMKMNNKFKMMEERIIK
jgi:hypothetical protein